MTKTITVEGDVSAADTLTELTTQGSVTAPSRQVPSNVSKIEKIIAGVGVDIAADGAASFLLRLGGNAVLNGEQSLFIAGAGGTAVQAGADPDGLITPAIILEDIDIAVRGGDTIKISAEMCGDDLGDAHIAITLVFS